MPSPEELAEFKARYPALAAVIKAQRPLGGCNAAFHAGISDAEYKRALSEFPEIMAELERLRKEPVRQIRRRHGQPEKETLPGGKGPTAVNGGLQLRG